MPLDSLRTRLHDGITLCGRFIVCPSLLHISVKCLKVDRNALFNLKREFRTCERIITLVTDF
ncbi:hypothetical protein HanRHA438_Chr11g0513521 [Helianthus annuus]|nr:hypothetical protein HanRHA438_Chr11g0513521 [Helianthus annuus]